MDGRSSDLARFPHEYGTWLAEGHTIPNGDPPERYSPDTKLCCAMITPPLTLPENAHRFESRLGPVSIYSVVLLFEEEMRLKLDRGSDALYSKLDHAGVNEILDPSRKPVVRKRLFGIF